MKPLIQSIPPFRSGLSRAFIMLLLPMTLLAQTAADLGTEALDIEPDQSIPLDSRVTTGTLDNGLRYYIRENAEPESRAELRLVVDVGSVLEDDDQQGMAHLLEHMAFNGTENFPRQELVAFMESIGMRLGHGVNATTSFDETVYQLRIPTDEARNLDTALSIMVDWAGGLTLDAEEIERERGVVIEEWRQGQGVQARIRDQQMPVLLRDSRYAERLPIGTLESLQNFDHEALRRFYRDWYRPELMAVIAVGDFDASELEQAIRDHFGALPASGEVRQRARFEVPPQQETTYSIVSDPELPVAQVALYHKMPAQLDRTVEDYRRLLTEQLYNALLNARFQERTLQPEPPFLAATSANSRLVRPVSGYLMAAAVQEDGIEQGLEALLNEAERVVQQGFTEAELERQKSVLLRAAEQQYNNRASRGSASLAAELSRAFLIDEPVPGAEWEYAVASRFVPEITLEEVNQVARDWISANDRVVVVTAPETPDAVLPTREALAGLVQAAGRAEIAAYEETTVDGELLDTLPPGAAVTATRQYAGGITAWTLDNDVRVLVKPTDFRADEVLFAALRPGGTSLASDDDFIAAETAMPLIASAGVGDFNTTGLQRVLAGKTANVMPVATAYEDRLNGNASPADLETLLQLVYLRMTAPRRDENFFRVFRNQMTAVLQNRSANPAAVFEDTFQRLMYDDHPRMQPPTVQMLEQADLDRSLAFYRDRLGDASGFTFLFVGSVDPDTLQPLVERYLGALPRSGKEHNWRDVGIRNPEGVIEETIRAGREPQARTRIAFNGSSFEIRDFPARMRMVAVTQALQTRLRDVLREQLGGTYTVQVSPNLEWRPVDHHNVIIDFAADPARIEELNGIVFDEISRLKTEGLSEAELSDIREGFRRDYETNSRQNGFWMQQLLLGVGMGLESPASQMITQPEVVDGLTQEGILDMARAILDENHHVRLTLLPEG